PKTHVIATRNAAGTFRKNSATPVITSILSIPPTALKSILKFYLITMPKALHPPSARARIPATPARFMQWFSCTCMT
ncbi:hypothetical protein OFN31_29560, partial [Escherichia coli]|nr:hypothetical protein [Escherichia coli]